MVFWVFYLVFPCLVCFSSAACLALLIRALRRRLFGRAAVLTVSVIVLGLVCLWTGYDDIRLVNQFWLELPVFALGLAVTWCLWRSAASWPAAYTAVILLVGFACAVVLLLGMVVSMHTLEDQTAISPDSKYCADLVYYDGMTFGYYYVAVKPTVWWHFWEPSHEVAEADAEGFDGIHWDGSRTLVLDYEKDASFAQQDHRWRDVRLLYHVAPSR